MKKFGTIYTDDAGIKWGGPHINAQSWEEAKSALEGLINYALVPPGTVIYGELIEEHDMSFGNLTWECHICHEERPDDKISVISKPLDIPGVVAEQNVRYCNDRQACVAGAQTYSFIKGENDNDDPDS